MAEFEEKVNPALRQAINEAYKEAIRAGAKGQTDPLTTIAKSLLAAAGKDGNGAAALSSGEPKQAWVEGSVEPTQRPSPAKASGGKGAEMQDLLARVSARVSDEVHRGPNTNKQVKKKATGEPAWEASGWLSAEKVSEEISKLLLVPLKEHYTQHHQVNSDNVTLELELVRAIGAENKKQGEGGCKAAVRRLLEHSKCVDVLTDFVSQKVEKLLAAAAASGAALNNKFVEDYQGKEMCFGYTRDFFKGLDGMIGPPNPNLLEGMRWEHWERKDSHKPFTATNTHIKTTSASEYSFVFEPDQLLRTTLGAGLSGQIDPQAQGKLSKLVVPSDQKVRGGEYYREPKPSSEFAAQMAAKNEQLDELELPRLQIEELCAARLYTGPMFMKYNAVLRGLPKLVEWLEKKMVELCDDNRYVTTLHCINSAIVKLGRLSKPRTVYRGLSGSVLPPQFWKGAGNGGVEFAFMSTTADREVAMRYANNDVSKDSSKGERANAKTVIEIEMGMIDRGADLQWLSQYPNEREITFAPFTGLEIVSTRIEESVLVVQMRLNVNLMSPTIETSVAKMRSAHVQLLDLIHSNLRAANAPKRVLLSLQGLKGAEKGKDADWFNKVVNFRNATEMALETQHEAFYALNDPALWEREEETLKKDAERRVKMLKELKNPEQVAALEQEEQALKDKVGKVVIPEKMRLSAAICARAGEHYVALQLLRQAARKDNQAITFATVSQDFHGTRSIRRRSSTFTMDDSVHEEVNENHRWKLELANHLMSLDVPSPWPATLCRLTTPQGTMGPQSAVDEEAGEDEGKVRDAVVDVIKRTLLEHTVHNDEDLQMEKTLGMRGLAKGVDLLVLRSSEVGGLTFKGWRKAKVGGMEEKPLFGPSDVTSRAKLEEYRIKKEGLATRLIVQASGGQGPPTIALATSHSTYEVEWAPLDDSAGSDAVSAADNWPDPGTYVITHLEAGDVIIQQMSGVVELSTSMSMASGLVAGAERADAAAAATDAPRGITKARLRNPQEHFLSAKMREGGNVQQYSSRQVAKGEVLLMPRVNPRVPSGAGALLREAAATGNDKLLKALLEAGVSVFEADHTATTAVHVAAEHGHVGAFKLLFNAMKQGGERQDALDQRNLNGKRVTDIYLESGHVPLARVVKPSESDQHIARLQKEEPEALEWMDRFSDSPEHQTEGQAPGLSRKRRSQLSLGGAQRLLTESEQQELAALATKTAVGGVTALMLASRLPTLFEAMFAVSALLQVKAVPTAETESGCTALSMAAEMGHVEVGKALLQAGAQVDAPLRDGKTPLMLSCKNGHCKMTELLLKHGAEPTEQERNGEQEGFTPIMHAALFGKVECVEVVIGHCEAHLQATFGSAAPPPSAAPHGKLQRMSSMARQMAVTEGGPTPLHDVLNARSVRENDTALMLASRHGQRKVVQLLLRKRASVDLSNLKGETALHMASRQGHAQVVCALLTGGAKADSPDGLGYTALHHCCVTNGGEDVADALLAIGAGVNVVNRDKNTPLHFACMAGNHRMVEALLKQKVDLSLRNANSQVAYDVATLAGHDNVKQKLQPVRTHMLLQMPSIKTEDEFIEARKFVREYGLQRLKRELVAPGLIDRFTGQLTTGMKPFNVFAKAGCADWKDRDPYVNDLLTTANKALEKADPEGAKQFKVAYNLAANDANWNSSAPEHLGKASMSKHHRFMIIRKPGPDYKPGENDPTDDDHRMDYTWTWFNVVTMGMRDVDPNGSLLDPDDISKLEADPEKNIAALKGAVRCLKRMRDVALAFVQEDRNKATGTTDWSDNIKLYFHCYPHCSVNSLHLHIVDADHLGPSHGLMDFKNLEIDIVIAAFEREIKEATVLNQTDA